MKKTKSSKKIILKITMSMTGGATLPLKGRNHESNGSASFHSTEIVATYQMVVRGA